MKKLVVMYEGEQGIDAGGLTKACIVGSSINWLTQN